MLQHSISSALFPPPGRLGNMRVFGGDTVRRIQDLRKYGLPDSLLEIWEQQQGDFLLPVQEVAVQRYGLFDGQSLVISSPTSSGKTFVGEMAAMRATFEGKRVLYLTPLRALAEEKFQTFSDRYSAYGVKVVVATRDHHEFDQTTWVRT